jgi:excisionase family DNA binding protein
MKLLDIIQLAEILNIKKKTIYEWVRQRKIPYIKLGGLIRFDPDEIEKWVGSKKVDKK